MAGTVTKTEVTHRRIKLVKFAWTSDSGSADATTTEHYTGKVVWFVTDPGSPAPTDNYDIAITDTNGVDVLAGAGADRDTSNTEYVASASLGAVVGSQLTLAVTNAGDAKQGVCYVYIEGP